MVLTAGPAVAAEPEASGTPPEVVPTHTSSHCTGAGIPVSQNCSGGYASPKECNLARTSDHSKVTRSCRKNRRDVNGAWYYGWWPKARGRSESPRILSPKDSLRKVPKISSLGR